MATRAAAAPSPSRRRYSKTTLPFIFARSAISRERAEGLDQRVQRRPERAHPLVLGAQLQQPLLGLDRQLDPGRDRVGVAAGQLVESPSRCLRRAAPAPRTSRAQPRPPPRRRPPRRRRRRSRSRRRGTRPPSKRSSTRNGSLAGDDDVHTPVVEALEDLGHARRAADPAGASVVVAEHDAERLLGLRGSVRSCACSAPRRCGAASARPGAGPRGVRRSVARPPLTPILSVSWRMPRDVDRFRGRGAARGHRGRGARGAPGAARRSSRTTACRSRSCGGRSPRIGWCCCPWSASWPAPGPATPARRSPSSPAWTLELLARQWRALGMPDPEEGEKAFGESDVEAAKRVQGPAGGPRHPGRRDARRSRA